MSGDRVQISPTLTKDAREVIKKGSLSFSLASMLLPKRKREAIHVLYRWCRFCDDYIDDLPASVPLETKIRHVEHLKNLTKQAIAGTYLNHPVFDGFGVIARHYGIPNHYPLELIHGMWMDANHQPLKDEEELIYYSYCVAGTVGLMFTHVVGLTSQDALQHAADLGIAMQLTNISRDIKEDAGKHRIYLPATWLDEAGVSAQELFDGTYDTRILKTVETLLSRAESYYLSGEKGLPMLPLQTAVAVYAARLIYAEIGYQVRKQGIDAIHHRVITSHRRKLYLAGKALLWGLAQLPKRLFAPRKTCTIENVWRFQWDAHK